MKVEFIKSPTGQGFAYFLGDIADLEDEVAEGLITAGIAILAKKGDEDGKKENRIDKKVKEVR